MHRVIFFSLLLSLSTFASVKEAKNYSEKPYVRLVAVKKLRKSIEKKNIIHLKKQLQTLRTRDLQSKKLEVSSPVKNN